MKKKRNAHKSKGGRKGVHAALLPVTHILLARLLELHDRYAQATPLGGVLGDGYLFSRNLLFRNVRREAERLGVKFTETDFCGYQSLPLAALEAILAKRMVPWHPTSLALKELHRVSKAELSTADFDFPNTSLVNGNHIMHETAHIIANCVLSTAPVPGLSEHQFHALRLLMSESYANTCETMLFAFVDDDADIHICNLNSFIGQHVKNRIVLLKSAAAEVGFDVVFRTAFLGYLFANFLYQDFKRQKFDLILKFVAKDGPHSFTRIQKDLLFHFFKCSFLLSQNFRLVTTKLYFKFVGIPGELDQVLNFNFLAAIFNDAELSVSLERLVEVSLQGSTVIPAANPDMAA